MAATTGIPNGKNGSWLLRWWPIVLFLVVQIAAAAVVAYRVSALETRVVSIEQNMVTKETLRLELQRRDDRIQRLQPSK